MGRSSAGVAAAVLLAGWVAQASEPTEDELYARASEAFERGSIEESVAAFDALAALAPESKPRLWQRGISLYYAGRFEDCVEQFEVHRTVNPHDVENSVWHYLCRARLEGAAAARKSFFPADDSRVPMMAVHRLFAGAGDVGEVFTEVEHKTATDDRRRVASFYGHLYVALWYESRDDPEKTRFHLGRALDGPEVGHYMEKVARVHLELLGDGRDP